VSRRSFNEDGSLARRRTGRAVASCVGGSTTHLRFLVFQLNKRELRLKKVELRRMPEESRERGERDARQSRKGSGSNLGRVANEKDLRQRTKKFALQIIHVFSELPKTTEAQVLGKQVLRSGTSVGANYREAYRARSRAEFIAKCGDSLRELEETTYWLELLVDGKIVPPDKLSTVRQECDELIAIFVTILKSSKNS
jgi:four helix bundle protein